MTSRFLAATLVAAVVVGLASDAQAQKRLGVVRNARKSKVDPARPEPASTANQAAPATPDPAAPADPFDSAAGQSQKTEGQAGESVGKADSPGETTEMTKGKAETATFGAGCFWHVESAFEWLPGVK